MKIVLMGYYGYKNIGDDLMLKNLLSFFLQIERISHIYVFTKDDYYEDINKVEYIVQKNSMSKFQRIFKIIQSDIVIWGGGTCFYDNSGLKNLYNYVKLSKYFGKSFVFLGVGIGDLKSEDYLKMTYFMLNSSKFIYFRDTDSSNFLNINSCVGGDLVFLSNFQPKDKNKSQQIRHISFSGIDTGYIDYELYVGCLKELIMQYNIIVHFIPAHIEDEKFHKQLYSYLPEDQVKLYEYDCNNYIETLKNMDFHIGMRLHSIVLSDILGIPNIAIKYSKKVKIYIDKTMHLNEFRLFEINEIFSYENMENIYQNYKYNDSFILSEKQSGEKCLNKFVTNMI